MTSTNVNVFVHEKAIKIDATPIPACAPVLKLRWEETSLTIFFMETQPSIETIKEMIKCLEQLKSQLTEKMESPTPSPASPSPSGANSSSSAFKINSPSDRDC